MEAPMLTGRLYSFLFQSLHLMLTIAMEALFFQFAFDQGRNVIYKHINQGNLWKHIKHKYEN
ncbi:cytochrome b-c1 complex subunit 9-like [Eptesicus fuscus]|uniref:cytochrome b-c1 complex subunit 9-like n=1 Tax=Eptesicus fuscus TaxID=29078 RepID=UPI002403E8A1|nr:cytochrome b-c1 complex subunit 9-like [Eptesicus fuscus]